MSDLRTTPFHSRHVAAGARMVPFAGFDMPVQYSGLKDEHLRVRASVGLFDVSHMGEVRYRGPKAQDALQWLLSNAVKRIGVGQAQYNAMCNERGGIVDDVYVYRLADDDFLVCVNAANRDKDFAWMVEHNPHGADLQDEGDAWAQVAVQGPDAVTVVSQLTAVVPEVKNQVVQGSFAGIAGCVIARTGYTGEDGFEVFLPAGDAGPAWDAILEAGQPHGILPIGLGARDTLRLEVRNALYGHELDDETSPWQAGLRWITKLKKPGGFIGSDAIDRRRETDTHQLVGMLIDGKRIAREDMPIVRDGEVIGRVTSGTRAPCVGLGVCLGFVPRALTAPGTRHTIDVRGREAEAVVIKGPFYDTATRTAASL